MAGPFLSRDHSHYVQLEATWATSPGGLAATDAFKTRTKFPFKRIVTRVDRDKDSDNGQASVVTTQKGRESAEFSLEGDLIPSGNAATPTEPDMDAFFEAHFGTKHKATANTTLTSGSTATIVNFAVGGVAASGTQVGDFITIDVDATFGLETRQVITIATDAVTVHAAFSAAPASGRNVYCGTTYRLSAAALKSVHIWEYLSGNNFRHKVGGCAVQQLKADFDATGEAPLATVTVAGPGEKIATHSTSIPTPTSAGQPLLPDKSYAWFGATKTCVTKVGIESNNGIELRSNESCSLFPTAVKRTGNDSRYSIMATLEALLVTGAIEGYFDNAAALTAYDILVQLGATQGKIVAWRTPKFIPDAEVGDTDGEVSIALSGRAYATTVDDEITFFFG